MTPTEISEPGNQAIVLESQKTATDRGEPASQPALPQPHIQASAQTAVHGTAPGTVTQPKTRHASRRAAQEKIAFAEKDLQESADDVRNGAALKVTEIGSQAGLLESKHSLLTVDLQIADLVRKASAAVGAAQTKFIPDITVVAQHSYQNGVLFLVHNFGTVGVNMSYDIFDFGRRSAEVRQHEVTTAKSRRRGIQGTS